MDIDASDALTHYGVLGMKWGKHKAKDVVSEADRKAAKKNYGEQMKIARSNKFDQLYEGKGSISSKKYKDLKTQDRTIDAGKTLLRTTVRKDEKYQDRLYVSTNKKDANRYRAVISNPGRGGKKSHIQTYEHTIKVTKKLTLPSERARMDAFYDIMNTPSIKMRSGKTISGRDYMIAMKAATKSQMRSYDNATLGQKYFDRMNHTATTDQPVNTAYFNKLREKGYNAVLDDNDVGVVGKDPIIILNTNGTIKNMAVKKLTNADIIAAEKTLSFELDKEG